MAQPAVDMWDEALARLRAGPQNEHTTPQPGPAENPFAAAEARLISEALADRLARKKKKDAGLYGDIGAALPEATIGEVQKVPGYSTGESLLNGLVQGFYPQLFAGATAKPFIQTNAGERQAAQTDYEKILGEKLGAKKDFARENPGTALTTEMLGSVATALPLMASGVGAAAPVGQAIRGLAPKAGGAAMDFLAGATKGAGAIPSMATRGAIEGTIGAGISSELSDKPLTDQMAVGALLGGGLGPLLGMASRKISSDIGPTAAGTAQSLIDQGVPVRAGQIPGASPITQGLDKIFSRGKNAEQNAAFAKAATDYEALTGYVAPAGTPASARPTPTSEISQKWVNTDQSRIGKNMNNIQGTYTIPALENDLLTDLAAVRANATANMSVENAKKVGQFVDKIEENVLNPINGKIYQNLTQKGGVLDNIARDKDIASAAPELRKALDEAWGRHLPADKKAAWDQARAEYKMNRTLNDAMTAEGTATGAFNPKKLLSAVEKHYENIGNAGKLGELAAGGQLLKAPGEGVLHGNSPYKLPLQVATGVAGGAAVSEGVKAASHYAPEFLAQVAHAPEQYIAPLMAAGGAFGGGSIANWLLNRPKATQHLLDVAMGRKSPVLQGVNPALPFLVEGANR